MPEEGNWQHIPYSGYSTAKSILKQTNEKAPIIFKQSILYIRRKKKVMVGAGGWEQPEHSEMLRYLRRNS